MPTVHCEAGFRFVIFVEDHEPAHLHVIGAGEAKIELGADGQIAIVYAMGISDADLRRVVRIARRRRVEFLMEWVKLHG